ncbi:PIN domain-containing protein [Bifidobacterium sp. ESL0728]|uniref:type II toxin-antitoxin system VapC family toxin n=1 Tax=Bifidobacterium sp. ESL0728 TaxID=2983220 RepID=UPI0023F95F0D|nr:PIN domain-containing protein [Bifidobacterium sp. ESL0728]WEV59416.1 PIN domain-containing protein [Bifidobacterium sp. ESL0728]
MKCKAFLDTNILLDIAVPDRPMHEAAVELCNAVASGSIEAAICAGSLKDFYYVSRHGIGDDAARRRWIRWLMAMFEVEGLDSLICDGAERSDEPDFEDGIIRACAERWHADYIVSRDVAAFARSSVPRVDTAQLLDRLYS